MHQKAPCVAERYGTNNKQGQLPTEDKGSHAISIGDCLSCHVSSISGLVLLCCNKTQVLGIPQCFDLRVHVRWFLGRSRYKAMVTAVHLDSSDLKVGLGNPTTASASLILLMCVCGILGFGSVKECHSLLALGWKQWTQLLSPVYMCFTKLSPTALYHKISWPKSMHLCCS